MSPRVAISPEVSGTGAHDDGAARERLLTQEEPSHAGGIADAVVIKDDELYFLCRPDGCVPIAEGHGLGLYFHDCRFLSGYELRIAGLQPEPLAADDEDGFRSVFQLTNPEIEPAGRGISRQRIGVRWRHVIDAPDRALRDEIEIENYDTTAHALAVTISLHADFRDVFVIRGLVDDRPGRLRPPTWDGDELVFAYEGGDRRLRQLRARFSDAPRWRRGAEIGLELQLAPHEIRKLVVTLSVIESDAAAPAVTVRARENGVRDAEAALDRSIDGWMSGFASVSASSMWVEKTIDRSLRDLRALRTTIDEHRFFAAGVPWFTTLFGRDSLLCALQTLAYRPEIASETLRLLASLRGRRHDSWRDEEPGKILHELRVGELARMGKIPYSPYYGTVDATPLFLIVLAEHARWTGDLSVFHELRDAVEAALHWIDEIGDHDGDGYVDYRAEAGHRLINQGWKDSGGAIVDARGRRAEPPIALVEVQGYVYAAKERMSELFDRAGEPERAARLRAGSRALRERFERDFWMADARFYAMALERGGRQVDAISSNPGHALWSGIVAPERAPDVVARLMQRDMYSGWGVRTLSSDERAYNPVGYHLGSVWPHDNAIVAAAFRRSGHDREACRVFSDLLHAASYFPGYRLPEVFAGYSREDFGIPVRYPIACHPQAWAAGSIPYLVQVLLGLTPRAFEKRLDVVRPCLPAFIDWLSIQHLRVGGAEVDLRFERGRGGELLARVERVEGELDVQVESCGHAPA